MSNSSTAAKPQALPGQTALTGDPFVGRVLSHYRLEERLGAGGMGVLYRAMDLKLGRAVAVKLLARHLVSDESAKARFVREARTASALDHPNIATVHEIGEEDGELFIAMAFYEGETLKQRLQNGRLGITEALDVLRQVSLGLAAAHRAGIVHRDIKPANILMTSGGTVKILDFGLAKLVSDSQGETMTQTGQAMGTILYMSPEQLRGESVDSRTDLWSLGILAYEMLAGISPFKTDSTASTAIRILNDEPASLAAVPGIPEWLAEFVSQLLRKNPAERPQSAGEVLKRLDHPTPSSTPRRKSRRTVLASLTRKRLVPAAVGVAVVAGVTGLIWFLVSPGRAGFGHRTAPATAPVTIAVLPLANLSGESGQEYFSDGLTEEIIGKLSRLRGLAVTARTSVTKYKGATAGAREIGAELGVSYLLEGSVRRAGDRIRVSATLVDTASSFRVWSEEIDGKLDDVFAVQDRVATRIVEALHVNLSVEEVTALTAWGTRNAAAYDEYLRGQALAEHFHQRDRLDAAHAHFERALAIDPGFAPAMAGLAEAETQVYRNFDSDPQRLQRAEALVTRALAIDPRLGRAHLAMALIRANRYDYAGASALFRQLVTDEPRNYLAWDYLCWSLGYLWPPPVAEAEDACRRALNINQVYAEPWYHLARVLILEGRLDEAEQALKQLEEHFPESSLIDAGRFWFFMGTNRPREALAARRSSPKTALFRAWTAMALASARETDKAFEELEAALEGGYRDGAELRGSPYFEPLRSDRRFAALLAKHGLTP